MPRRLTLLAPLTATLALVVACGGAAAPTATPTRAAAPTSAPAQSAQPTATQVPLTTAVPTPASTPTKTVAKTRGRVTVAQISGFDFDADISRFRSGNTRPILLNINDTLVARDEDGKWFGLLAESWTAAPNKWTFKIKKGVKFHDGTTMKASDIKFTIDRELAETFYIYRGEIAGSISSVDAPDDTTLIVNTKQPYPVWLYRAEVGSAALPEAYYTRVGQAEFGKKPIGVGAFKLVSRQLDIRTELTAFDDYHLGAPQVRDLVIIPVPEPSTRLAMLKAGEADMEQQVTGAQAVGLKNDPNFRLIVTPYSDTRPVKFWDFLDDDPTKPIANLKVRQAIAYAIDRQTIADRVFFGYAAPAAGAYNPLMIGFNPNLKPYPYDVAKAKQLLQEAGYANGFDIVFRTGVADQVYVQAIQAYLKDVGINAKIQVEEGVGAPPSVAKLVNRGLSLSTGPALAFPDAEQIFWLFYLRLGTSGAWEDKKAYDMYDKIHVETDLPTRIRLLQESEAYMYEQLPIIPVIHTHGVFAVNKKIDFKPTPGNYNIDPSRRITWMPGY
ncbi:MAG: hypothetical protein EXR60_03665 [Dehalococcoidia bacterium]|nr:hypothetical protein [Dehalococcoidia bacterium]